MPFVLDASVSAVWALSDEASSVADAAESRLMNDVAIVPYIWWYEIRNILLINERRQRLTEADSEEFLQNLAPMPIQIDQSGTQDAIFRLARKFRLSYYDAAYLEVAERRSLPLSTLDTALQSAAAAAGVPLMT
jgi:predicted nucleic acid-binding protein